MQKELDDVMTSLMALKVFYFAEVILTASTSSSS